MDARKERDINLVTDLTLGLIETLSSLPGIKDVSVNLRPGAEKTTISAWEQRHGVILPPGLRHLYLTTDGFSLTWNYAIGGKTLPLGNLEFHLLSKLNRVGSGRSSGDALVPSLVDLSLAEDPSAASGHSPRTTLTNSHAIGAPFWDPNKGKTNTFPAPSFHISKLFELDNCRGYGKVVIAYPGRFETFPEASIWFIDLAMRCHLLATDVIFYWRLLLVYLGMPEWQSLAAGMGLTPWARQWYEVLAPHILDGSSRPFRAVQPELINKLDWSFFKMKKTHKNKFHKEKDGRRENGKIIKENVGDVSKPTREVRDKSRNTKDPLRDIGKGC